MADDKAKKPKIDLKARLGKTQMGMGAPAAIPAPPASQSGMPPAPASDPGRASAPPAPASRPSNVPNAVPAPPMGIAPPPGLSPGIPLPPFGPQPRQVQRAEPKQSAAQQTIKVEIGEEIHEERKKARRNAALAAFGGAIIGLGIGFVGGGSSEKGDRAKNAAKGAALLEKDVKAAGEKLKELDAKLTEASDTKLKNKAFPDDLGTALAGLTIPFDATNLDNKGVNGMPAKLFKLVLNFTSAAENINKSRETLKNLLGLAKEPITKAWKEETAPVTNFSILFRQEAGKYVVGELVPNPGGFAWKGDFPEKYKITKIEGGKPVEKEVKRYVKGDLPGNDPQAVPLDPKTTAQFSSEVVVGRLYNAIRDIRTELQGNKDNPQNETPGLLKMADDLAVELHKASLNQ